MQTTKVIKTLLNDDSERYNNNNNSKNNNQNNKMTPSNVAKMSRKDKKSKLTRKYILKWE